MPLPDDWKKLSALDKLTSAQLMAGDEVIMLTVANKGARAELREIQSIIIDETFNATQLPGGVESNDTVIIKRGGDYFVATMNQVLGGVVSALEEYPTLGDFPTPGDGNTAYVALDTGVTYRWSGSTYVAVMPSLALGETNTTAYRGDRGKTAYDHSQVTSGNPHNVTATEVGAIPNTEKGANSGVAELDSGGKIPIAQLPSYVSDVFEYANVAAFPNPGVTNRIYVALDTNLTYRWGGSSYVEISPSLALGETDSTAYRGDRGKIAYDYVTASLDALPSDLTETDVVEVIRGGTRYEGTGKQLLDGLISALISESPPPFLLYRPSLESAYVYNGFDFNAPPLETGWFYASSGTHTNGPSMSGSSRIVIEQVWGNLAPGNKHGLQRVTQTLTGYMWQRTWHEDSPGSWQNIIG